MLRGVKRIFTLGKPRFATVKTQKLFDQRIDRLVQTIRQQLKPTFLRVRDISLKTIDDDQMIRIQVQSQMFKDIPKVDQHRMVITCFGELIEDIHAFLIKTRIPLKDNVVIIKPEEQILEHDLNDQGTIPLANIRKAIHEVQAQDMPQQNKELRQKTSADGKQEKPKDSGQK